MLLLISVVILLSRVQTNFMTVRGCEVLSLTHENAVDLVWVEFLNTRDDGTGNTYRLSKHESTPLHDLLFTDRHFLRVSFKRSLVNFRAAIAQSV
jgi:hypothetical protein